MSCGNKQTKVTAPNVLLSEPQMVEIMTDVYILENAINHRRGKSISTNNLKTKGYEALFEHYGITDSVFYENVDYYNDNPVVMKRVMDSVLVNFESLRN
jgi:hypothetical protein